MKTHLNDTLLYLPCGKTVVHQLCNGLSCFFQEINNGLRFTLFLLLAVPKWILEGRCNMGLFLQGDQGTKKSGEDADDNIDDLVIVNLSRIEYFPHNDSLNAFYRCNQETRTRTRACTFFDNVGIH